jgi:hypothetical protein
MDKRKKESLKKIVDELIKPPNKQGNGILKFSASVNSQGKIARYSLAYINYNIYRSDNGRVLGYDNDHGYHHRHYMGKVEAIDFTTYEDIAERFKNEWREIHEKAQV